MEYNTQREKLVIPEYGRNVQQLVDHCLTIQDKNERTEFAKNVINVMGLLNPQLREVELQHKLWDQLLIMSRFKLDIDSPFPLITQEIINTPPDNMPYPTKEGKFRFYGKNVKRLIELVKEMEEGENKQYMVKIIADLMKKYYVQWNKDNVDDDIILSHLDELSAGKLKLKEGQELCSARAMNNTKPAFNKNQNSKKYKTNRKQNN